MLPLSCDKNLYLNVQQIWEIVLLFLQKIRQGNEKAEYVSDSMNEINIGGAWGAY